MRGERTANVGELIEAICTAFTNAGGQQISVFVDGHGCSGVMSAGYGDGTAGVTYDNSMGNSATVIDANNAAWFGNQIKDKVSTITLFGCSVAEGQGGQDMLDDIGNADLQAKAYDQTVCTAGGVNGTHKPTDGATLKCSDQ